MSSKGKSKKRSAPCQKSSRDDSSDDSEVRRQLSHESDIELMQDIYVDFGAQSPVESDFHGIKQLLLRVFLMLHVDVSELSDVIILQSSVGSTIKIVEDEDDDVYGIVSVISFKEHQGKNCIKQLRQELLSKCKSSANKHYQKLETIFEEKNIGFLVNERFINIPSQIAVPFHNSLRKEVEEAKSEDSSFDFDYLLILSKTLRPTTHPTKFHEEESTSKARKKKKKKSVNEENNNVVEYTNFEDEIFHKASELSFSYCVTKATGFAVSGDWDFGDQPMNTYRTVMLMPKTKWKHALTEIEQMVVKC